VNKEAAMKANALVGFLLLCCLGCTSQQSDQLTQQQKDRITGEVKAVYDGIMAKWRALDAEGVLQYYSPDMVCVSGGVRHDFQAYRKNWIDYVNSRAAITVTPTREDLVVLADDVVIATWVGRVVSSMKSGDKRTTDPTIYTNVLKKVGDQWKIVYEHGSGTVVPETAAAP
jgi:ketosteroid isomerase-like protein